MRTILELTEAMDGRDPWVEGVSFLREYGFEHIVGGLLDKQGTPVAMLVSAPPDYVDHYTRETYAVDDPWWLEAKRNERRSSFTFDRDRPLDTFAAPSARAHALFDDQGEAGLLRSLYIPVGGHSLRGGLNLWTGMKRGEFERLLHDHGPTIEGAAALIVHEAKRGAHGRLSPNGNAPAASRQCGKTLSPRQLEALTWLARGERNDRIADRLCLSVATVNLHIASARKRLGARTREEAVAIAVREGFIEP